MYVCMYVCMYTNLGGPRVETLVASRFVYEAFRRSTSSSLKAKTLVEGPFDGSRTFTVPPSLFTILLYPVWTAKQTYNRLDIWYRLVI